MYVFMNMYTHTCTHVHILMTYVENGVYQRPTTEARIRGAHATPVLLLLLSRVSAASASNSLPRSFLHLLLLRRICSHPLHFLRRSLLQPATLGRRVAVARAARAFSQRASINCYASQSKKGGTRRTEFLWRSIQAACKLRNKAWQAYIELTKSY